MRSPRAFSNAWAIFSGPGAALYQPYMSSEPDTGMTYVKKPEIGAAQSDASGAATARHEPLWRRFDPDWYTERYPEAATLMAAAGIDDPEAFYLAQGARLGHSPNMFFDEVWYLSRYPDIAAHVASGGARSGFEHYCRDGHPGRSPHWLFDEAFYQFVNTDITRATLDRLGFLNGYDHYLEVGDQELRIGHKFFSGDLFQRNCNDPVDPSERWLSPFRRFLRQGCRAGSTTRVSWYFDPDWYLATYPEVRAEIDKGWWSCALHHFLCNNTPQRYEAVEWFSEEFYSKTYPDVLKAVGDGAFRNCYAHFISHGAAERRKPHPDVDLVAYYRSRRVQADLERGEFFDSFAHWIAHRDTPAPPPPVLEAQSKQLSVRTAENLLPQFAYAPLDFSIGTSPAVSVIMVVHNQFALTMMALASLRSTCRRDIELILVDSGSADETLHIARYLKAAHLIRIRHNAGFIESCNRALERATAPAVLYLNNDLTLGINALEAALRRLASDDRIGAVGGKIIRTNGVLQEAGSIVWRDGSTAGYLRDADPNLPEANFVRDVDFCSGAFLLARTSLVRSLGGFDDIYRPAYYEETDLCVRMRKNGFRIVYDPSVVVQHFEYGSSGSSRSEAMIARNHGVFVDRHRDWLRYQYPPRPRNALFARTSRPSPKRILFIEDRVPLRGLGSGYVRSNDIIRTMAALGYHVSVYPVFASGTSPLEIFHEFPDTVEVLYDRGVEQLPGFIEERAGFFDIVWIGRTHNLERLLLILSDGSTFLPEHGFVLDTEAVVAPRVVERARVLGLPMADDLDVLLRRELACAYFCQKIVAVSERDARWIRQAGYSDASVLGHVTEPSPTPAGWEARSSLLFVGALHEVSSPNYDSLQWFVDEILPLLQNRLPEDVRFTIAGFVDHRVDMSRFGRDGRVDLLGAVEDLSALYGSHRVFVAPTRFAGGIPFKVHEAAAHGVPVVATELLCGQVGWSDGSEIMSGGTDDPARFAERIIELYENPDLWNRVRAGALRRIESENSRAEYSRRLSEILAEMIGAEDRP